MARTKDFDEQEVLNKAVDLFWLKGYNGTSMQDLVEGLGISRSSLYDTFGDKHNLFVRALERYQGTASNKVWEIMNTAGSSKDSIRLLLEFVTTELLGDGNRKGCFMVNAEVEVASHDQQISDMICVTDQQIENAVYLAIVKGQEKGEIAPEKDARALARFTFNTIKGIRVAVKTTDDRAVFDDIINLAMSVFD